METLNVNYEIGTDRFLGRAQLVYYPLPANACYIMTLVFTFK